MNRRWIVLPVLLLVILAGGVAHWWLTSAPPPVPTDIGIVPAPSTEPRAETPEDKTRRQLVGTWHDEYKGKRTMTLNADGTGVMDVELSGAQAFLMAPKLRFDMKWSLKDKTLTKITVSGEPADKVNLILKTMGNTSDETIQEVNEQHLLTLDKDGKTKYDWKRVKTDR